MVDFNGDRIDFLSKLGYRVNGKIELSRDPTKALTSGSYTSANVQKQMLYGNKGYNLSLWTKNMPIFSDFAEEFTVE